MAMLRDLWKISRWSHNPEHICRHCEHPDAKTWDGHFCKLTLVPSNASAQAEARPLEKASKIERNAKKTPNRGRPIKQIWSHLEIYHSPQIPQPPLELVFLSLQKTGFALDGDGDQSVDDRSDGVF